MTAPQMHCLQLQPCELQREVVESQLQPCTVKVLMTLVLLLRYALQPSVHLPPTAQCLLLHPRQGKALLAWQLLLGRWVLWAC